MDNNYKYDSPFLNLLKPENLNKIKIDERLIPAFKKIVLNINEFFVNNKLMDVKDWQSFFDRYLLSDSEEQLHIKYETLSRDDPAGGEYSKKESRISIEKDFGNKTFDSLCDSLCHEFIHFLVMADSNDLTSQVSICNFFNEGLTDLLSQKVMNYVTGGYMLEVRMANFYCSFFNEGDVFASFLNDKFCFSDFYAAPAIRRDALFFEKQKSWKSLYGIQRVIIERSLNEYDIVTFDDFVNVVNKINSRPYFDYENTMCFFKRIIEDYLSKLSVSIEEKVLLTEKLTTFCLLSNKFHLYGENEVCEYLLDDLHFAFDKNGKSYNEFPKKGKNTGGSTHFNGRILEVEHNDKKYSFDLNTVQFRRWDFVYKQHFQEIAEIFKSYDKKKQRK